MWELPSALGDNEHVVKFFRNQFGFNQKETTAILGLYFFKKLNLFLLKDELFAHIQSADNSNFS